MTLASRLTALATLLSIALAAGPARAGDAGRQQVSVLAQDAHERVVGVALVQKHGLAEFPGQRELFPEDPLLVLARREVAEVVETALTGCPDFRL